VVCHLPIYLFGVGSGVLPAYLFRLVDGVLSAHLSIWSGEWNAIFTSIYLELGVTCYLFIHLSGLGSHVISTLLSIRNWG